MYNFVKQKANNVLRVHLKFIEARLIELICGSIINALKPVSEY